MMMQIPAIVHIIGFIWLPPFVIESLLSYGQGQANMTASFIHWTSLLMICLCSSSFD
ncbi:hypothetical protein BAME_10030 [Bacillus sp. M 2-6]|nr:hypothetical protein BAME_10030 [Bacillus sp. M 2-6]